MEENDKVKIQLKNTENENKRKIQKSIERNCMGIKDNIQCRLTMKGEKYIKTKKKTE